MGTPHAIADEPRHCLASWFPPAHQPEQARRHGGNARSSACRPMEWQGACQHGNVRWRADSPRAACLAWRGLQANRAGSAEDSCKVTAGDKRVTCYVTCSRRTGTRSGRRYARSIPVRRGTARNPAPGGPLCDPVALAVLFPANDTRYVTRNAPSPSRLTPGIARGVLRHGPAVRIAQGFARAIPDFGGVCAVALQKAGIPIAPSPSPPHAEDERVARPSD
jgi:hypothetical protein